MNEIDTDGRRSGDPADPTGDPTPTTFAAWLANCFANEATERDIANIRRWGMWMVAWALLSFADAEWVGAERGVTSAATLGLEALVLVTLVGTVLAYARYVRETDELNRSIQLRAFSVGFAAGFLSLQVAEGVVNAGLVESVDSDISALVMLLTWAATSGVLQRRYR